MEEPKSPIEKVSNEELFNSKKKKHNIYFKGV